MMKTVENKPYREICRKELTVSIKQASYNFELVHRQFEKITQGKKVFSPGFLGGIYQANSNNEMYENITLLHQYVQEFGDKTPKEIDIIDIIKNALKKASKMDQQPIKTVFGDFEGKTYSDIAIKSLEILNEFRYLHIDEVFELLIPLSKDSESNIKKKVFEVLNNISKYDLHVLKKIGFYPQLYILEKIRKWDDEKIIDNLELLLEAANQLLQPSFEGLSSDHKGVTFHHGPLPINHQLKSIRSRSINLLKKLFSMSKDISYQRRILQVMQEATQAPLQGNYGDDMEKMVLDDTNTIIDYYIKIAPLADNEIIQEIDKHTHWFTRRHNKEKLPNIEQLQSVIASNKEYEMFSVFVGYEYKFDDELNWEKTDKLRRDKIQKFIDDISDKNWEEWRQRILSVRKNYSANDVGEFQYFNIFLFELGKQKPKFALLLIEKNEKDLEPFLIHLVAGVWKSKLKMNAKSIISEWTNHYKHLWVCAYIFEYVEEIDLPLIKKIFKRASENKDTTALNYIAGSIARNYSKHKGLRLLFINLIKELTKNNDSRWINIVWFRKEIQTILETLPEKDHDVILENLLLLPNIDYHAEEILMPIAEKYPRKVVWFFKNRVNKQASKKQDERYDAIPFSLHKINKVLQKHTKVFVSEVLQWFSEKEWLFEWEASQFLQKIFSTFTSELESELIKLIKSGTKENARIVLWVLKAYQGEKFLHNVCMEFIKKYPKNEKYKKEMFIILSQTGGVTGEYGFVEAYKNKKDEIQDWKKDPNDAIQSFVKQYEVFLEKSIAYEQKQADEEIELRKREFS